MHSIQRWGVMLAWGLFLLGLLGVAFIQHVPEQLSFAFTGTPGVFPLTLPPQLPLWLIWGCVLGAFLLWQANDRPMLPIPPSRSLIPSVILLLIAGLGLWLRLFPLFDTPARAAASSLDYDEAIYAGAASLMRQGYWPYRDFFLAHPPLGIALLSGALWLRGAVHIDLPTFVALRQLVAVCDSLAIVGCYLTVRQIGGVGAGWLAALAYATGGMLVLVGRAIMLEPLQAALLTFAAAAYVRCLDQPRARRWAAVAGGLAAMACLVKLTGSVLVIAMLLQLVWLRRWRELGALMLAGIATTVVLLVPFLIHAPLELISQIVIAQLGRGLDGAVPFRRGKLLMNSPDQAFIAVGSALGMVWLGLAAARQKLHPGWALLLLWGMGLWAAVGNWASFFPHYYVTLAIAPACLVGALLLPMSARPDWRLAATGLATVLLAVTLARETMVYRDLKARDDLIADAIALRADPDQSAVLAFEPTIPILAGRNPPRLPDQKFFLDTYLWWSYVQRQGGDSHAQVLAMLDQSQLVILNGEELNRIDEPLLPILKQRMLQEFWYRPLVHTPLYYRVDNKNPVLFDNMIALLKSEPPRWQAEAHSVEVMTYWRADPIPTTDQALFVHMFNPANERVAQIDIPLLGPYPWQANAVMPTAIRFPVPPELPDGDYRLVMGLYSFSTGQRLLINSGGDTVEIARVRCQGGQCQNQPTP